MRLLVLLALFPLMAQARYPNVVTYPYTVTLNVASPGITIPADFVGISWETRFLQSYDPTSNFSAMLGVLGANAHIRFGGFSADVTQYLPTIPQVTAMANAVHALGWTSQFSVACQLNDPTFAASEVAAWNAVLGATATYEIGNEPNNYGSHGFDGEVNPCYTFSAFSTTWQGIRTGIIGSVPAAKFSGPATWVETASGQYPDVWTPEFAADTIGGYSSALTSHVYGSNASSGSTLIDVLRAWNNQTIVNETAAVPVNASVIASGLKPRMNESGSLIGKPLAASNYAEGATISASLWDLWAMILLARNGWSGVDFHNGAGFIGQQSAFIPLQNVANVYQPLSTFYAMVMFNYLSGGQVLPFTANTLPSSAPAIAVKTAGGANDVLVVNMDFARSLCLQVGSSGAFTSVSELLYTAPAYDSPSVTLGGATISTGGVFSPATTTIVKVGSTAPVCIPASSAALLTLS